MLLINCPKTVASSLLEKEGDSTLGNWRRASLRGTLAAEDVEAAQAFVLVDYDNDASQYGKWHPLACSTRPGLAGLGMWPSTEIRADGNLSERDYDDYAVANALRHLVRFAPSLELKVHLGDDWESETCVTTITVHACEVVIGEPEVATVPGIDDATLQRRLLDALGGCQ